MTVKTDLPETVRPALRRAAGLTLIGLWAEAILRAFWPAFAVLFVLIGASLLGLSRVFDAPVYWSVLGLCALAILFFAMRGARRFARPTAAHALARIDDTLPGHPIAALSDTQAIGADDTQAQAVWHAHLSRMAARLRGVKPVGPDMNVAPQDPWGLRLMAVIVLITGILFGTVDQLTPPDGTDAPNGAALALGPSWEGWIEPPLYTGKPGLYLNEITADTVTVPEGSQVTLRIYGDQSAIGLSETVSGTDTPAASGANSIGFNIANAGEIEIGGPTGRAWEVLLIPDQPPVVSFVGDIEWMADGEMRQGFTAQDDYGVSRGQVQITLDMDALDRRHGLLADPDPRTAIVLDLPMPVTGNRADFGELLIENLSEHPWVGLPVRFEATAQDSLGQTSEPDVANRILPGRRFFHPVAGAIIEQRRDLLWARSNAPRVAQILRAISHRPADIFRDSSVYLRLREVVRQIETAADTDTGLSAEQQDEIAAVLWDMALDLEVGSLEDARERLERAQERLSEAMRNGASQDEIAELMRELREATDDYIRQLAESGQQQQQNQQSAQNQQSQEITQDQLSEMLDELERLMQEGRMAEAQQLMQQLAELMQNMQVTQGQPGQGDGEQAMQGLSDTLREQQELSDESFRNLQDRFNPGRDGQGREEGGDQGQSDQDNQAQEGTGPNGDEQSLAERQQALRDELRRQQENLPALGGENGEATQEALDRAGRAMEEAEGALRDDDIAGALDSQAEAMEALRDGMRNMGQALAEQQQQGQGQQGEAIGRAQQDGSSDPLGRRQGTIGSSDGQEDVLGNGDPQRRAQELLDEIQRRSGEQSRPQEERDYLERLLDRF